MREVVHQYGVELDWVADLAGKLGGYVDGNHIIVTGDEWPGLRYVLPINEKITAFVVDVVYNEDIIYRLRNTHHDFVAAFFNLTDGQAVHILDNVSRPIGRWGHNLSIFDSNLCGDYSIKAGSITFMVAIFIKKEALKEYFSQHSHYEKVLESAFDPEQNTFIKFDRMSNQAWWLMDELRKTPATGPLYEVMVTGTVYGLLSDYLDQTINQEIIMEKVVQQDVVNIIASQAGIIDHIEENFAGIHTLAANAQMSETKYKRLFKKITGITPNAFFLKNKLAFAKEDLETGNFTIAEIADKFHFTDASYLIEQFKNAYGITPKEYLTLL